MTWTDPATGEVVPVPKAWQGFRARAEALRDDKPETPHEVDVLMRQIEDLGFALADFALAVNNDRYAAELAYSKRKNAALAKHGRTASSVTVAKALAEADAETEFQALLAAKAIYHHVEDIKNALTRKHFGLMNTNKGIQGMTGARHGRGA